MKREENSTGGDFRFSVEEKYSFSNWMEYLLGGGTSVRLAKNFVSGNKTLPLFAFDKMR